MASDNFYAESPRQDAIIRQLEIIGETAKRLSSDLRSHHSETAWHSIAGLRDVLIHNYPGVELQIVWDVAQRALPQLKPAVESILAEESRS